VNWLISHLVIFNLRISSENWVIENRLFCLNFFKESVSSMTEPKSISQSTRVNCPSVNIYLSSNIFQYFSHLPPIERLNIFQFFLIFNQLSNFCVIGCTNSRVANVFEMSKIKEQGQKHKKRMNDSFALNFFVKITLDLSHSSLLSSSFLIHF